MVGEETIQLFTRPAYECKSHLRGRSSFITIQSIMTHGKNLAGNLLPYTVSEGLTVNVLPNEAHEFLMTGKEVAHGYGVTDYNIRQHKLQRPDELIAGKHYVIAVSIPNGDKSIPHNSVLWTKRGIIRLGFFIKSAQAKIFRDWAEELIIQVDQARDLFGVVSSKRALPKKTKANRLTQDRMISILAEVCKIEDATLRMSISNKLLGGQAL